MAVWDECDGDIGPGQPEAAIPENPESRDDPGLAAENLLEGQNRRLQHGRKGGETTRKQPQRHTGVNPRLPCEPELDAYVAAHDSR
eukprot:CAMPEP_0179000036 /NCGR_PEP_ID=MMETSP0795-20121207/10430_1 /TAXON_ID=88552 /ORGANISM="Amoebophrya sp., Strain Ameob2" /LENGTH=85 /DNA_ID=CAMNT_0020692951 /DNA_START=343 /DNA_END=600 /DNA_ORIENTATION=-